MPQGKTDTHKPVRSLPKAPTFDSSDLSLMLRSYDRTPFLDVLEQWIGCAPTSEDIADFAAKKPDLWVKAIADLAKIGGYTEKQEVLHTVNVHQMSDSQLEDQARAMAAKLGVDFSPRLLTQQNAAPEPIPSKNEMAREFDGEIIDAEIVPSSSVRPTRHRKSPTSNKK